MHVALLGYWKEYFVVNSFAADDMNGELTPEERVPRSAGAYALLPKETSSPFIFLPFVQKSENDCSVACAWDSSLHDDPSLNVPSSSGERIYATVKVMRLSNLTLYFLDLCFYF